MIFLISQAFPAKWTGIIALVFLVKLFLIESTDKLRFSSTSANTGVAPLSRTEVAVATKVISGTITSSPFLIPNAFRDRCKAEVAFETPIANFELVNFEKFFSKLSKLEPFVRILDFKALSTTLWSDLEIDGLKKGTFTLEFPKGFFYFALDISTNFTIF